MKFLKDFGFACPETWTANLTKYTQQKYKCNNHSHELNFIYSKDLFLF